MSEVLAQLEKKGGSGDLYKLVKEATVINAGTGTTYQSFSAEIGKRYLVFALRYSGTEGAAADVSISSGAIIDNMFINNIAVSSTRVKIWAAIVKATATTVTMAGTNNGACYMPLDN